MDAQNIKALIGKLNPTLARGLEAAAGACIQRTHFEISLEHLLLKLLDVERCDLALILQHFGQNLDSARAELDKAMLRLKTENYSKPRFSPTLLEILNQAWNFASMERGEARLRSGHLLVALLREAMWLSSSPFQSFQNLSEAAVLAAFEEATARGEEAQRRSSAPGSGQPGAGQPGAGGVLEEFTVNLTRQAREGKIDPVLGRDHEIHQVIDILSRRRKNNPILVGEPGVGKSAIVEGLALLIAQGKVPPMLARTEIRNLDLGMLKAGASMKGEFEDRLKNVIDAVQNSSDPIILFIDEAHTLIGAGGAAGSGDAANLLKPALARGQLRTVAATTWSEYKKYIEKDPALERRFQLVKVDEPDVAKACAMLRGIKGKYEEHHKVVVLDSALEAAVSLSQRFISGRQLPDKAIDLLDTACARVHLSLESIPLEMTRLENAIEAISTEIEAKKHETALTDQPAKRLPELEAQRVSLGEELAALRTRWESEKALVEKIVALETQQAEPGSEQAQASLAELRALQKELETLAGESPLVEYRVAPATISNIVSQWTGIPVGKMVRDALSDILTIEEKLKARVLGQDHAAERIARAIKASKAKVNNPDTPIGVFLAVGPSGTGKTEMALALADILFGGERFLVQINMSEYQEKHTVSRLIGSPPGYVGYGEGGVLSEAVRIRPYTVVLLDEVEKGHPDVMNLFYQVFDKGHLADGEGRIIDFRNTIVMMTSNLGSQTIEDLCSQSDAPSPHDLLEAIRPTLNQFFKPALLARMTVLPYYSISEAVMKRIVTLKLRKIVKRLQENHGITTRIEPPVLQSIADRCRLVEAGARNIDHILNSELLPLIASEILTTMLAGGGKETLTIGVEGDQFTLAFT